MSASKLKIEAIKSLNGYTIMGQLGKGSFGVVYKVKKDDQIYAIKTIRNRSTNLSGIS